MYKHRNEDSGTHTRHSGLDPESPEYNMKTDIHSHIIPFIDDGAKTMEEAISLAKSMHAWGFERITCTPHIMRLYPNTPDVILKAFDEFREALALSGCPVDLRVSAEYRLNPELWNEVLEKNWLIPIEDKYILMEFPIGNPNDMDGLVPLEEFKKVISLGLTPVLPHPERYAWLPHDELLRYVDTGVLIQSNYGSLAGLYGAEPQKLAQRYLNEGIISFLSTDMHNQQYIDSIGAWLDEGNELWNLE